MNIKPRTNRPGRTKKPAANRVNRLQALEGTLLAHQMSEAAGKQASTKKSPIERQQSAVHPQTEQVTSVEARIDVGFGNSVFIRGQGAGLSWEKGLPLTCVGRSAWVWSTKQAKDKVVFKLILNDQVWAQGQDVIVEAGKKIEVVPVF